MNKQVETLEKLVCGTVLFADKDVDRIAYLKNILDFIDYSLVVIDTPASLKSFLNDYDGIGFLTLFLGPELTDDEIMQLEQTVEASDAAPAFVRIEQEDGAQATKHGSQFLGSLKLPTRYDVLASILNRAQLYQEQRRGQGGEKRPLELFRSLSGNSRATRRINKMIEQVANTEATVLILGESGTGKEVVARKLHYNSSRRGKPFVPINCGAIPSDLLESELFGHEKGAFTGAISARQGRFEMAHGGTLFLDEIGDMSMPMQVKLLRVLQERTFERVGSNRTLQCDVRIIAATHRDLEQAIKLDKFREDLYYRLNVFPIDMPPLRERVDDIPVLINDLISRIETEKRGSVRLTPTAIMALGQYSWPGNVRELANMIERLAILHPYGVVDVKELPEKFRSGFTVSEQQQALPLVTVPGDEPETVVSVPRLPNTGIDLKVHLSNVEMGLIRQALDESEGVVAHAAKRLKMRRTTLVEKLRKYGLQRGQELTGI
jgi:sigma-54 specific flagellar transcriptional regulator A